MITYNLPAMFFGIGATLKASDVLEVGPLYQVRLQTLGTFGRPLVTEEPGFLGRIWDKIRIAILDLLHTLSFGILPDEGRIARENIELVRAANEALKFKLETATDYNVRFWRVDGSVVTFQFTIRQAGIEAASAAGFFSDALIDARMTADLPTASQVQRMTWGVPWWLAAIAAVPLGFFGFKYVVAEIRRPKGKPAQGNPCPKKRAAA